MNGTLYETFMLHFLKYLLKETTTPEGEEVSGTSSSSYVDSITHKPEGRLAKSGDLKLLNSEEPLYIPITQDPSPMTEDMLEEHAEVLAR